MKMCFLVLQIGGNDILNEKPLDNISNINTNIANNGGLAKGMIYDLVSKYMPFIFFE